jgi:hypothetical protein
MPISKLGQRRQVVIPKEKRREHALLCLASLWKAKPSMKHWQ